MKILVINGPNLSLLGMRDKSQYGILTLKMIEAKIQNEFPKDDFTFFQSNSEHDICDSIQDSNQFDGIILNPGGFSHTSVAIRDAIEASGRPIIEVHLSNISSRENFRKTQLTSSKTSGYVSGFKENSYLAGVFILKKMFEAKQLEGAK
ncbi:MAG: 3-dehydroquinate dehydratase type II [Ignavibacteria bacterium]|nr:MAG: 3-dehydroquinate dehydratase type II [Ignavibacteria bacterium]KAF0162078.1 MAG: 3-dehydroquinate dehydratase type II [Ignavibacteria bacterium]